MVCIHYNKKQWSGLTYVETRADFAFCFNKAAQTEANLYNLRKKQIPSWLC